MPIDWQVEVGVLSLYLFSAVKYPHYLHRVGEWHARPSLHSWWYLDTCVRGVFFFRKTRFYVHTHFTLLISIFDSVCIFLFFFLVSQRNMWTTQQCPKTLFIYNHNLKASNKTVQSTLKSKNRYQQQTVSLHVNLSCDPTANYTQLLSSSQELLLKASRMTVSNRLAMLYSHFVYTVSTLFSRRGQHLTDFTWEFKVFVWINNDEYSAAAECNIPEKNNWIELVSDYSRVLACHYWFRKN